MPNFFQRSISKILLLSVVMVFVFGAAIVAQPIKKTQASTFGQTIPAGLDAIGAVKSLLSVPVAEQFSWHTFLKDVFTQIALGVAYKIAMNFLNKFVKKLTEKYKIRNFLYYDQILTNYYLTNFIRDKISDPDLRRIYILLESAYITGQPTGTANAPNPSAAIIPRLKLAISEVYKKQTGIDPNVIANPPATISNRDYLTQAQFFYFNHPGYTEANLRYQFGAFQSSATTAAQLEVLVGNSLKAGRFIGGQCSVVNPNETAGDPTGNTTAVIDAQINSPESCAAAGGTWQTAALDQARSFIDNPTAFVDKWMLSGIQEIAGANFRADNFWFVIGNHLGNFLWNNLFLDKPNGVLNEDPRGYTFEVFDAPEVSVGGIDTDGDGTTDGYDIDNDGVIDNCVYGGTAPNCEGSASVGTGGPSGPTPCTGVAMPQSYDDELAAAIDEVKVTNPNGIADEMNTEENARIFLDEVEIVLADMGLNASNEVLNGNNNPNRGDIIAVWGNDGNIFAERYDVIRDVGAGDTPLRDSTYIGYVNHVLIADCIP